MGLLLKILTLPVLGPIEGVIWLAERINEQVNRELYDDDDDVRGKLLELELRFDLGEINEEEYLATEEALLARLKVIEERMKNGGRE